MKLKEAINIIIDIEKMVPVNQIEFKNIKIWPLIRSEIWRELTNPAIKKPKKKNPLLLKKIRMKYSFLKIFKIFTYTKTYIFKKNIYKTKKVVFIPSPAFKWEKINGKYFRPFSNSLQDILKEMKVESVILDCLAKTPHPLYGDFYPVQPEIEKARLKQRLLNFLKKTFNLEKEEEEIYLWTKLMDFISTKYPFLILDKKSVIHQSNQIIFYEKIFKKILKKIKPKICFLVCYYSSMNMGYIKACRALNIKSVEIQHGIQGKFDGPYTYWTKLPQNGYELLPSHWWNWGKKSAEQINNWSKMIHPEHQAIIGGNPWVAKNTNNDYKTNDIYIDRIESTLTLKNKINVLIALQPIQTPINNILINAIANSPVNVNWFIRLHPKMLKQKGEIKQLLKKTGNKNIEVDCSSKTSLFNILKRVDFLITFWSSVAYEALLFKVHPIIIHPNGKNTFTEYINNNLFTYADSPQKIIETIQKDKSNFNFKEETPYMETEISKIKEVLIKLLKS